MTANRRYFSVAARLILLTASLLVACTSLEATQHNDLSTLMDSLAGEYEGETVFGGSTAKRIVHKIAPIELPKLGQDILYYQLSEIKDGESVLQQKLFVFEPAAKDENIRMRAYFLPPGKFAADLEQRPDEWAGLKADKLMSFPDSCAFIWRADETGFAGVVQPENCRYESPGFRQFVRAEMRYRVTDRTFEWTENLLGDDGSVLVSTGGKLIAYRR